MQSAYQYLKKKLLISFLFEVFNQFVNPILVCHLRFLYLLKRSYDYLKFYASIRKNPQGWLWEWKYAIIIKSLKGLIC